MNTNNPSIVIGSVLQKFGFGETGSRQWLRKNASVWNLVELQKSDSGDQYFVNLGVWMPSLDSNPKPRVRNCHLQIRLERFGSSSEQIEEALDFEHTQMPAERRQFEIYCAMNDAEQKFFGVFTSLNAAIKYLSSHPTGHFAVHRDLVKSLQGQVNAPSRLSSE
jgi:hypothetical protein